MRSTRFIQLLMVAVSATATSALHLDAGLFGGVYHEGAVKRQDDNVSEDANPIQSLLAADDPTSVTQDSSPTTASEEDEATSTTERTTVAVPSTAPTAAPTRESTTEQTTPTAQPTTPTTEDTPTTTERTTTDNDAPTTAPTGVSRTTTATNGNEPTTTTEGDRTDQTTATSAAPEETQRSTQTSSWTSVITETAVVTQTDENGQQTTFSTQTTRTSTGAALVTSDADSNNPGMSKDNQKIIIGVTVGVGGAIILGAAALLYWRLRNKKRSGEENEDLVSYGTGFPGPGTAEKSEPASSPGGRSPFQSTLESYHAPTSTNAASNF